MAIPRSPYIAGKALSGVRGFVGRDDVFQLVETVFSQSDANAIVLFGQRRIGKTSILLNLQDRMPSPPFVTVFFDLQDRARKPLGEVLFELAQTIARDLDLPSPDSARFDDNGAGFRDSFLPTVYEALGDQRRLVLLFDEFDVLDARLEEQLPETSAARAFIPAMRRLINEEPQLAFVFVVGRKADELSIEFMSAFKTARFYRISVLDAEAARHLVLTAQREGALLFADGVPERVIALTSGHPYFTQLLCQLLFERVYTAPDSLRENEIAGIVPTVTLADVQAIVPKALEAGEHIFEWIWDGLPPAERVIFSAMAAGTDEQTVITQERLLDVLQAQGIRILIRELELAPKTLMEWQMLKQADGGYQFFVELMRRWVEERKPLPRVKEELDRVNPLADTLYQGAAGFYRSGDFDGAVNQLQTALRVNPNHLKARLLLGDIYKYQGKPDEAVHELAEAYRIDPDGARMAYENALLVQAEMAEQETRIDDAIAVYGVVLGISPNNRVAQERRQQAERVVKQNAILDQAARAEQYERAEQWDDAIIAYQHLISMSDDPRWLESLERAERERALAARYAEGIAMSSKRQWTEAHQAFSDVVTLRPGYKDSVVRLEDAALRDQKQRVKHHRDAKFLLTTPLGRWSFWLAWVCAGTAGWFVVLTVMGVDLRRRISSGAPSIYDPLPIPALATLLIVMALISVPILQSLLLRRFLRTSDASTAFPSENVTILPDEMVEPTQVKGLHASSRVLDEAMSPRSDTPETVLAAYIGKAKKMLRDHPGRLVVFFLAALSFSLMGGFLVIPFGLASLFAIAFFRRSRGGSMRWFVLNGLAGFFVAIPISYAVIIVEGYYPMMESSTDATSVWAMWGGQVLLIAMLALVTGSVASYIQSVEFRDFKLAKRWTPISLLGRAVGIAAGFLVALFITSVTTSALMSSGMSAESLSPHWFALVLGATLWGAISGASTGSVVTRMLALEEQRSHLVDPGLINIGANRAIQTWLPILSGLAATAAIGAVVALMSRLP